MQKSRCVQNYFKIQMAGSHLISHKDHITDLAVVLDTSSTTIEGMMEPNLVHKLFLCRKEQCSTEKSQLMKLTGFWAAQALTKKDVVSRPLKIMMLSFIHHPWHFHNPDQFLSHSCDRF